MAHDKLLALGYTGFERTTSRAVAAVKRDYRLGRVRVHRQGHHLTGKIVGYSVYYSVDDPRSFSASRRRLVRTERRRIGIVRYSTQGLHGKTLDAVHRIAGKLSQVEHPRLARTMGSELTTVVGDYPHTADILSRRVQHPGVRLVFKQYSPLRSAFAAMVERREFDVSEMALATYVQARGAGRPITLLPVTLVARFQHPFIMKHADRAISGPSDLEGRCVGLQSYAQTTGVWARGILDRQFGVDLSSIHWVALEQTHVGGFDPPDNVEVAAEGATMADLLASGKIDAAVVSKPLRGVSDVVCLFDDVAAVTEDWYRRTGVLQVNHVVCVATDIVEESPEAVRALLSMFARARDNAGPSELTAGLAWAQDLDLLPFGTASFSPALHLILELCIEQGLVGPELSMEDLTHPLIPQLEP